MHPLLAVAPHPSAHHPHCIRTATTTTTTTRHMSGTYHKPYLAICSRYQRSKPRQSACDVMLDGRMMRVYLCLAVKKDVATLLPVAAGVGEAAARALVSCSDVGWAAAAVAPQSLARLRPVPSTLPEGHAS